MLHNQSPNVKSEIELFRVDPMNYLVEWVVPDLDLVEHVGIFCCEVEKTVSDYDGLFEMPEEIIEFLEKQGFDCTYLKE
jgi:adenylate cyclase class IV